jgi:FdhD protein
LHRSIQSDLLPASIGLPRSDQRRRAGSRILAEETPIALVYNGSTLAVVMASPVDLTDLAIGFSLTEGIVRSPAEIDDIEIAHHPDGIELRVWLASECGRRLLARRRQLVGPTGCGLCGIESLCEANRPLPRVRRAISLPARHIAKAVRALTNEQHLNVATRATHAAGFYRPAHPSVLVREDVGRHNALDKLAGALAAANVSADTGMLVVTSRVSIELVQKAATIGASVLIAVSAPTARAVRSAELSGITLIGIARGEEFEVFSHGDAIDYSLLEVSAFQA